MADSLVELLDQIEDIVTPAPVSMAPATPAWAIVAIAVVAALAVALWAWRRHRHATAWRRAALADLRALAPGLEAGDPAALAALQTLLRRVALVSADRAEVAALSGEAWARYLADTGAGFGPLGPDLARAPYRPVAGYDGRAALAAARAWIGHRHA